MIGFKKISLDAKEDVWQYTLQSEVRNCDFSFANLCSWSFLYRTEYAIFDGFLLLRFYIDDQMVYMAPVGVGDMASVIRQMKEDADNLGKSFRIMGISQMMKERLEELFPGCFLFEENRDYADYIYFRTDLAELKGKKFQAKRNHLNRFRKEYPSFEYRALTTDLISECLCLEERWCRMNGCNEQLALSAERSSMHYALGHMEELGITGGVLLVDGTIVAFTYGAPINKDTWDVCVEKANTEIEGSYAMINYEYVNQINEKYVYINREEDLGLDGLRKAKLSYHPHCLLEKYNAKWL